MVIINILLSILGFFISAYFQKKGENLATKQDIAAITERVESVKDVYSKSLEEFKAQLTRDFEASKAEVEVAVRLDSELIDLSSKANDSMFKFSQLKDLSQAGTVLDDLAFLTQFLVKYKVRYGHLEATSSILAVNNEFSRLKESEHPVSGLEIIAIAERLDTAIQALLGQFISRKQQRSIEPEPDPPTPN